MLSLKIKKSYLICGIVIFLQLLWMLKKVFWPSLSGSVYQIVFYMKYLATFALMIYTLSIERNIDTVNRKKGFIKLFGPLFLLYFVVEAVAMISSPVVSEYGLSYWTRCVALLLDKMCVLAMASCFWLLFEKKAIDSMTTILIIIGFLQLMVILMRTGISETLQVFGIVFGLSDSNAASKLLETNEYTFALGLLLIYYVFFRKKEGVKIGFRIVCLSILLIVGGKRIAFGGIVAAGLFAFIVRKKGLRRGSLVTLGLLGVVISMLYIAMCYSGEAMLLLASKGIDVMGRDVIYNYFTSRTEFAYNFMGWGLSGVSKVIENLTKTDVGNMASVRGLHNDLLKIYIELGFCGGLLWFLYHLVYFPRKLFINFGKKDATLYMSLILYAFITYLTDNTENYFVFQVVLWLIPLSYDPDNSYDIFEKSENADNCVLDVQEGCT